MELKHKKIISYLLLLSLFFYSYWLKPVSQVLAAHGLEKFEQQINISNGEFSTTNTTDSPTDNSLGLISFDSAQYDGDVVYFEALMKCVTCSGGNSRVSASLYNDSGSSAATVTTTSGSYTLVRSGSIAPAADDYTVRFKLDATSGTAFIKAARLIIVQTNTTGITDTQTHIEVGHYENTTATSATEITAPKYYVYDDSKFSGTKNAYFEATIKTTGSSTTGAYYFDTYDTGTEEWSTTPANMADNDTGTYAATSTNSDVELLTGNSNAGTNLGTITAVEVRAFTYQNNDTTGTLTLRPVFSGSSDGNNHDVTPPQDVGAWSAYQTITTDTNAPGTWTWSDVQNLNLDVVWNQNAGSNTGFVSSVQVRVTYEDNTVIAYAQLYNKTNSTIVATVTSSAESYARIRSSALTSNWDTGNPDQYAVRIYTSSGANIAYLGNAKIVIDQTESGGVKELELAHQLVTTERTQTNTSYTQETFTQSYTPGSFETPHTRKVYFDTTIKTSGGTGYAQLYNISDTDAIDTSVTSEVTTTSTSYEQKLSSNLGRNSDWPTATKSLDAIIKASSSQTAYISSARILIEIANLDPSLTLSIAGVASGQTHNSITTSITSTSTTLPFGNITPGTPKYGAHEIAITTNDSVETFAVLVRLSALIQGLYPGNNFDPFVGNSATWSSPQSWIEPTGTVANSNTGWFGANTTDTTLSGWSGGGSIFGPIGVTDTVIVQSSTGLTKTEYITYGIEANAAQPADLYSGTRIYTVIQGF